MALKYKIPPGNPTVVWDDVEGVPGSATNDPYTSWQYHLGRTGRGGVDMTARWINLYAPIDCRVEHYQNGAGTAVRMWAADNSGWSDVFDHMSSIAVPNNAIVPFGGLVGASGDTGAAGSPHLHWHRLAPDGVTRKIPWDYFTDGTTTPPSTSQEQFMRNVTNAATGHSYLVGPQYIHHLPDANYKNASIKAYGAITSYDAVAFHCLTDTLGIPWSTIPTVGPGAGWAHGRGLFSYPW